jgi:hypothetical protein
MWRRTSFRTAELPRGLTCHPLHCKFCCWEYEQLLLWKLNFSKGITYSMNFSSVKRCGLQFRGCKCTPAPHWPVSRGYAMLLSRSKPQASLVVTVRFCFEGTGPAWSRLSHASEQLLWEMFPESRFYPPVSVKSYLVCTIRRCLSQLTVQARDSFPL